MGEKPAGEERPVRGPSITIKVNLIIVLTLTLGIGGMTLYFGWSLITTREDLTRDAAAEAGDLLYQSIKNFMIPGEAPLAVDFFKDIALMRPDFKITLYRKNGDYAFSDNTTLETVNKNQSKIKFQPRDRPPPMPETRYENEFKSSLSPMPGEIFFTQPEDGRIYTHAYRPLLNLPKCTVCHGSDHTVRGVIDIKTDVTEAVRAQSATVGVTAGIFLGVLVLLALVLSQYLGRIVILPVKAIGRVCTRVTGGDFEGRVTVKGRDEIGGLASTVNTMVEGLKERFELTKYVSSSTIESLKGDQAGRRVLRLVFFSDIRGFTSYSEASGPERVVGYLNKILEMQSEIVTEAGGDVDKFVGDSVVATFPEDRGAAACKAAVAIRDRMREAREEYDGLSVGIGIAFGDVIQGMIGSIRRADFTVIGDTVNTASRLCSTAKADQIIVSRAVKERAGDGFAFEGPFRARLKGKAEPEIVYMLKGRAAS
jgi:adenylate cyclase